MTSGKKRPKVKFGSLDIFVKISTAPLKSERLRKPFLGHTVNFPVPHAGMQLVCCGRDKPNVFNIAT